MANELAVALWRCNYPKGIILKPKSILATESNFGLDDNTDLIIPEERKVCINVIRNKRNN